MTRAHAFDDTVSAFWTVLILAAIVGAVLAVGFFIYNQGKLGGYRDVLHGYATIQQYTLRNRTCMVVVTTDGYRELDSCR